MKTISTSLLLLLATASGASAHETLQAVRPPRYRLVVIEPQDDYPLASSGVSDVSDQGLVVGGLNIDGAWVRFEWTVSAGLSFPTHLPPTGARRVNNFGDSILYAGGTTTVILASGTQIPVPPPPNSDSGVNRDLNDALLVVGNSVSTGTSSSLFTWNPLTGTETILIPSAKELSRVNARSLAVGTITFNGTDTRGILVDVATHAWVDFGAILPGPGGSEAVDVNDLGRVTGFGPNGAGLGGFVWDATNGFGFLPALEGGSTSYVRPKAIDNAGRVVGTAITGAEERRAFLWDPNLGILDLTDLVVGAGDFQIISANDISETGLIVGHGFHGATWGPDRGFILVPVDPTPIPMESRRP